MDDERIKCAQCQRLILEGRDAIEVREGVVGLRGFIPLEAVLCLCGKNCLLSYFGSRDGVVYELPPRIP